MTKYHIYFHDDFDGMASGAVMLDFLNRRGDGIISFNPINYTPSLKNNWANFKFKEPFILVDFLYHPRAVWWFDHHETSFLNPSWRKKYKNDKTHSFDQSFKSCCGVTFAWLKKEHGYKPPEHIKYLAKWADIIDSSGYKSAKQPVERKEPALKFISFLDSLDRQIDKAHKASATFIIKQLAAKPIADFIKLARVAKSIKGEDVKINKSLGRFKNFAESRGEVIFIDVTEANLAVAHHYFAYHLYPKTIFSILLSFYGSNYHLSVGRNPWRRNDYNGSINIGDLMSKYGGGGHKNIGGLERKSKKETMTITEEIIKYLNG